MSSLPQQCLQGIEAIGIGWLVEQPGIVDHVGQQHGGGRDVGCHDSALRSPTGAGGAERRHQRNNGSVMELE